MLFLIIFVASLAISFVSAWWMAAVIAFVAAIYAGKSAGYAFWSGFFALSLVWLLLALFKSIPNNHLLAGRVAQMVHLPGWVWLLIVTVVIGGLVGGMSSLSGLLVKQALVKESSRS